MGALPMNKKRVARLLKLCREAVDINPDITVAHAPFLEDRGVGRLVINGSKHGTSKKLVALQAEVTPARVISVSLKTNGTPMGYPLIGFDGEVAESYFGDPDSKTRGIKELAATLYPEGYAAMSHTSMDNSQQVIRGLMPIDVATFAGICLGVIISKEDQ